MAVALVFGPAGGGLCQIAGNSKAPIDITASTAEVISAQCQTIWRGSAEALQDRTRLRADTIKVYAHPKGTGANGQADCGATDRIEAEGHVFYVDADQNARADKAVYSQGADQIVMTGNVIVVQGPNVARGERLTIKVSTREARMEAGGGSGRVRAVIYPDKSPTTGESRR